MNFGQLIIFFLFINIAVADDLKQALWKNLLHGNEVISPGWSVSEKEIADYSCEYPARAYLQAKDSGTLHNLDNCSALNDFITTFEKKYVSLVLTSEYYNAPSSAFGHIMLLLHNEVNPELNSTVIHFSAMTRQDDFLHYTANGLSGKYYGHFFQEPFFKKLNEYSNIEQRYLFIHTLSMTPDDKKMLLYHLFELKKARFKYYFLAKNCGYQIDKLLQIAFAEPSASDTIYVLPSDVLKKYKNRIEYSLTIPPLSIRAKNSIHTLSKSEKNQFKKIIISDSSLKELPANLDDNIKRSLYLYSQYQFRKKKMVVPFYDDIQKLTFPNEESESDERVESPLYKKSSRRISVESFFNNKTSEKEFQLSFRPVLIDMQDFQNKSLHESDFNIFNTELKYAKSKLALNRFEVINLKLISPTEEFFREPSWFLSLAADRENSDHYLEASASFGAGQAYGREISFAWFMGPSLDVQEKEHFKPAFLLATDAFSYLTDSIKILLQTKYKISRGKDFFKSDLQLMKDYKNFSLSGGLEQERFLSEFLRLNFYF